MYICIYECMYVCMHLGTYIGILYFMNIFFSMKVRQTASDFDAD